MGTGGGEGSGPGLRLGRGRLQGRGAAGYGGTNPTDNRIDKVNDLYFRCIAVRFLGGGGPLQEFSPVDTAATAQGNRERRSERDIGLCDKAAAAVSAGRAHFEWLFSGSWKFHRLRS